MYSIEVPGGLKKLQEACRENPPLILSRNDFMVPSYDPRTYSKFISNCPSGGFGVLALLWGEFGAGTSSTVVASHQCNRG